MDAAIRGRGTSSSEEEDRLLEVEEAAVGSQISTDTLYRKARELPFTVRIGGNVRFSAQGISRFIATRQGRSRYLLRLDIQRYILSTWAEEASSGRG